MRTALEDVVILRSDLIQNFQTTTAEQVEIESKPAVDLLDKRKALAKEILSDVDGLLHGRLELAVKA